MNIFQPRQGGISEPPSRILTKCLKNTFKSNFNIESLWSAFWPRSGRRTRSHRIEFWQNLGKILRNQILISSHFEYILAPSPLRMIHFFSLSTFLTLWRIRGGISEPPSRILIKSRQNTFKSNFSFNSFWTHYSLDRGGGPGATRQNSDKISASSSFQIKF